VPALVTQMGRHFGELREAQALITETLRGPRKRAFGRRWTVA